MVRVMAKAVFRDLIVIITPPNARDHHLKFNRVSVHDT